MGFVCLDCPVTRLDVVDPVFKGVCIAGVRNRSGLLFLHFEVKIGSVFIFKLASHVHMAVPVDLTPGGD